MANTIVRGSDLMLFYNGKSLAFATNHQLSLSGEAKETSSKDSGQWTSKMIGKLSWSITSDNLFTETDYDSMVDLWIARTPIEVIFTVKGNSETNNEDGTVVPTGGWTPKAASGYKGKVVITGITANAPDNENATYSITLEGAGALTKIAA